MIGCPECIRTHNPAHQEFKIISEYLLSKYIFLKCLGKGGSGTVFEVYSKKKKSIIALKVVNIQEMFDELDDPGMNIDKLKEINENEIVIHRELNHDNIIKYHESVWVEKEKMFLIELEKGDNDLKHFIRSLKEEEADTMFYDLCCAVKFLHKNDIKHRDLKPGNILIKISEDNQKIVKLADFGGAKLQTLYATKKKTTLHGGTSAYLAPELLINSNVEFTKATDIWALGIIYHQMLSGGINPFPEKNDILRNTPKFSKDIKKAKIEEIISRKESLFFNFYFFVIRMFDF